MEERDDKYVPQIGDRVQRVDGRLGEVDGLVPGGHFVEVAWDGTHRLTERRIQEPVETIAYYQRGDDPVVVLAPGHIPVGTPVEIRGYRPGGTLWFGPAVCVDGSNPGSVVVDQRVSADPARWERVLYARSDVRRARASESLVDFLVEGLMREELTATEAAAQRLLVILGVEGLRKRASRDTTIPPLEHADSPGARITRLLVDDVPVWEARRTWDRQRTHFDTRWLVDPERIAR
jgi:hypothetical protein